MELSQMYEQKESYELQLQLQLGVNSNDYEGVCSRV